MLVILTFGQYAPIVFQNISEGALTFTQAGVTLCEITVPSMGGPVANRVAPLLFSESEVQFGAFGGVRSYGPTGSTGGNVYVFGKVKTGLLLGRAPASSVTDPTTVSLCPLLVTDKL